MAEQEEPRTSMKKQYIVFLGRAKEGGGGGRVKSCGKGGCKAVNSQALAVPVTLKGKKRLTKIEISGKDGAFALFLIKF